MKPVVYYIDDSRDALDLAEMIVKDDPRFDFVGVQTENELYAELNKRTPNAIMLDLNLGQNLTGSVLSIKLRKQFPDIPMAIYTSYEGTRVEQLILEDELVSKKTVVWQKSEVGVDELADHIAQLVGE